MNMKKGQLASMDLLAALFGFVLVMIFVISIWALYMNRLNTSIENRDLELSALQTVDTLLRSTGTPSNWEINPNTSEVLGFSSLAGSIDTEKLSAFLKLSYNSTATKLKIKRFKFNFSVYNLNGTILNSTGLFTNGTKQVVSVDRLVIIKNETRKISFTLWRK